MRSQAQFPVPKRNTRRRRRTRAGRVNGKVFAIRPAFATPSAKTRRLCNPFGEDQAVWDAWNRRQSMVHGDSRYARGAARSKPVLLAVFFRVIPDDFLAKPMLGMNSGKALLDGHQV